jgi:hypothetical protein
MKKTLHSLFCLLLLAVPAAVKAQFYYSLNPNVGFSLNALTYQITGYYGPDGAVNIPSTYNGWPVTTIGEDAFLDAMGVTNVTLPASVTTIGIGAFSDTGLTSVTLSSSVTNIGPEAFADCASLTNVILSEGLNIIGPGAFSNCTALTNIAIPSSVISIGPFAFSSCVSLTNATISSGVISIGDAAFNDCYSLASVTIPGSISNIGENAFADCRYLTSITVQATNSSYSSVDGVLYDKSATTLIQAPGALNAGFTIPSGVTSIGAGAFSQSRLTSVTIPGSVTTIGASAFDSCVWLTNVTILNGVSTIGAGAFNRCLDLSSVAIPVSVSKIGAYAFSECNMASITFPGNVASIGDYAFYQGNLNSLYFGGNAPTADSTALYAASPDRPLTVYYLPGTTGWSSTFAGVPTALWHLPYPTILNNEPNFGVQSNMFSFTISWATNISFVVEASTNLAGSVWTPIQTNMLSNGSFYFSEPVQANGAGRFYRISAR